MKELSVGEVAKELNEPYHRVIRRIKRGELPGSRKVGWGWVIPKDALKQQDTWSSNINKITGAKLDVQLISDKFDFIPSYALRKVLNNG